MKTYSIIILFVFTAIIWISYGLRKKKQTLPIPENNIEQIVIGTNPGEYRITNESTKNAIIKILKKAYYSEINKSSNEKVKIRIETSSPQNGQSYYLIKRMNIYLSYR